MIDELQMICIAFYQRKFDDAKAVFFQKLGTIAEVLEKSNHQKGIAILDDILNSAESGDFVLLADQLLFDLIPILQELGCN